MMDVPEPEDLYDDFEPEGQEAEPLDLAHKDGQNSAPHKGINGKSRPRQPDRVPDPSPRAASETNRDDLKKIEQDMDEGALEDGELASDGFDESELDEILAALFETQPRSARPNARPLQSISRQAAALVARHGNLTSTAAVFKDGAARVTSGSAAPRGSAIHEINASAALLENTSLVQAMARASARASHETEAGLLAAALVPLLMQGYPSVYRGLWPAIPALSAGAAVLARFLHHSQALRPLVTDLPALLHRVLERLAHELASGRPISSQMTAGILAKYTGAWLSARTSGQPARQQGHLHQRGEE